MSIETAMNALNAPSTTPASTQQSISPKEVAAATVEAASKSVNDAKLVDSATDNKDGGVGAIPAETQTPTSTKEEASSAKFSALAKKEKAIVTKTNELKAKEASFAEREAKIAAREAKIKESESLWDTDVFKALEARGYDYTKLTQLMLEGKTVAPESQDPVVLAKKTIEQFKTEQKQRDEERAANETKAKADAEAKQKQELEEAWAAYNTEVQEFTSKNADDYELINTYSQQGLVAQTVDEFYNKNKRVLSIKEASDMVESYLESEAKKALATKKFGSAKKDSGEPTPTSNKEAKTTKTLTNEMQPTSASVLPAASERDRMKRAMAALESKS